MLQVVRAAVLDLMTNMMAANSAFVQSCLQVLLFSMLPPPAPPAPVDAAQLGTAWQPSEQAVEVQGQVLGAMEKVRGGDATVAAELQHAWCTAQQ